MTFLKIQLLGILVFFSLIGNSQMVSTYFDSAQFKITDDLIFDQQGNLFGSDYSGNSVYKISTNGAVSSFVSGLHAPNGLAFDSNGNLFICDNTGNRIFKVDPNGLPLDTIDIVNPSGIIKQMGSDTMVFTTYAGHKLIKLAPDGTMIDWHSGPPLRGPVGLAYDDFGKLYLGNFTDRKIFEVRKDSLVYIATVPGTGGSSLGFISYSNNFLWATNFQNHKIYRVHLGYTDSVVLFAGSTAGSTEGSIDSAKFNRPNGILAKGDSLFISEYGTGKIRLISNVSLGIYSPIRTDYVDVFPNPAKEFIRIKFSELVEGENWQVMDQNGRIIRSGRVFDSEMEIDIRQMPRGIYFFQIINTKENFGSYRFIKN
tara:strand:+ start:6607 stop:7716 length:1110 start_codon:yes stop_codon:yes gene_type:complete